MKRYFFNLYNDDITEDFEGVELADDDAACERAMKEARNLAAESVRCGHLVGNHYIEIVDADRKVVGSVRFDEAVAVS